MREYIDQLENRTQTFNVQVIRLCALLVRYLELRTVMFQLGDAAGSVGANHRAMRRARSGREFFAKLSIVCEETDESVYWLEVLTQTAPPELLQRVEVLLAEARELRAIFNAARRTARGAA